VYLTTFPQRCEYEKMRVRLDTLGLPYTVVIPGPGYSLVGCPAIVMDHDTRSQLASSSSDDIVSSGWVDYRPASAEVPDRLPPHFPDDLFGMASVMVLAPCIADQTKVRMIAHISGDMTAVFPYLNSEMGAAYYNPDGRTLTFMEGYHMMTLYPRRVAIAKADDIVDGWRVLEAIRCRVNEVYSRRTFIEPLYTKRDKPPALDIYKRLPRTNCRRCGQNTCMAFALSLHSGQTRPFLCQPVFEEDYAHLRDGFREIVARLGFTADDVSSEHP
jgi:ArsR family metal-binding transcriptional regulator